MKTSANSVTAKLVVGVVLLASEFFVPTAIAGQVPPVRWAVKAGGNNSESAFGIAVDAAGNSYITGQFSSSPPNFGGANLQNRGAYDMFVVKYDNTGKLLWAKGAGGTGNDSGTSIAVDGTGNCYVTGVFESSSLTFGGNNTVTNAGIGNIVVAKFDSTGNIVWLTSVGGTDYDAGTSIAVDASGNCFLTGYFGSSIAAFGTLALTNTGAGFQDIFLAKYDSDGNVLWVKSAGGNDNDDGANGIAVDTIGNIYLTGFFSSTSARFDGSVLTNSAAPYWDIFVAKYDVTGGLLWARQAGGTLDDQASAIAVDPAGNCYVTGSFDSDRPRFGNLTLTNLGLSGLSDLFLAQFDGAGKLMWARTGGGYKYESGASVAVDSAGNCQVIGYFNSTNALFSSVTLTNAGLLLTDDVCIAGYDREGTLLWAQRTGGTSNDRGYGIGLDAAGNSYITGSFRGPASFGATNLASSGFDLFVARIDALPRMEALPRLICSQDTSRVLLSWSTNQADFRLQSALSLASTNMWSAVTNTPAVVAGLNFVTNALIGTQKFYRLTKP